VGDVSTFAAERLMIEDSHANDGDLARALPRR
jgi:hypothetical protein